MELYGHISCFHLIYHYIKKTEVMKKAATMILEIKSWKTKLEAASAYGPHFFQGVSLFNFTVIYAITGRPKACSDG